ncbi:galactosyl transferase GMA12/MNN10 family protein [Collimonas fungivorans]|uniref:Galactosyl transferase GMA12/MNN10 family protein n=1 Tax=Collimonas fungivorans TaxID=158899 RepID=A0A127PCS2_9BURK|nr:hypothetical protein [Collimonas fungivorans]AMO95598.1 galactosyl transferase GMA12/MNN10 family protein [Collimonas fungivorans]
MIVISLLSNTTSASFTNHRWYCEQHGYRHVVIDTSCIPANRQHQAILKYQVLLRTLREAEPEALVALLSEDSAIVRAHPLPELMEGRSYLLVVTDGQLPQADVTIWRNTGEVREMVSQITNACKFGSGFESEAQVLGRWPSVHFSSQIGNCLPAMISKVDADPAWARIPTFSLSFDDPLTNAAGKGVSPRFRETLIEHVNANLMEGKQLFSTTMQPDTEAREAHSTYNPGSSIALVMLYTPNISIYGEIAERNLRRYCDRHNYTLHIHRSVPAELQLAASGNWVKPWLLNTYISSHEWVFWIDADVLVTDQGRKLEPLLSQRERVLAQDVSWNMNSGIMGFRNTPENAALLTGLMDDIRAVADKSSVYASQGDQYFFIQALLRAGMLNDADVLDITTINTPWFMKQPDTFMTHYFHMWPQIRAMMMERDDMSCA